VVPRVVFFHHSENQPFFMSGVKEELGERDLKVRKPERGQDQKVESVISVSFKDFCLYSNKEEMKLSCPTCGELLLKEKSLYHLNLVNLICYHCPKLIKCIQVKDEAQATLECLEYFYEVYTKPALPEKNVADNEEGDPS
jgi:ssDNA-binding Zn-finger/Zn-ribbon topoisomerase 1